MRYFTLLDFQQWIVALSLGLLAVILLYVAWMLSPNTEEGETRNVESVPAGHVPGSNPIPPILILIAFYALLWALSYVFDAIVDATTFG